MLTKTADAKQVDKTDKELLRVDVEFRGDKLIIPEGLSYDEAIRSLHLKEEEENSLVSISEIVRCFPMDGAVAMHKALAKIYSWTTLIPTQGFWGPQPPTMVSVEIGYNKTMQVPWGMCRVPKIDGELGTSYLSEDDLPIFRLTGQVKRKDERHVTKIAAEMRRIIAEESIYKGKAIKINFRDIDGDRKDFSPALAPRFIDLHSDVPEPIFSHDVETQLQTSLYAPIKYTEQCVRHNIPLKRGILLEGTFGTGKTLTAHQLARVCVEQGWTFIYLEDVRDLGIGIGMAKLYEPAVLFAEDVDKTVKGERDVHMDQILNMIDGVESKDRKIMVVLTTNNLNYINPAFVRPGRIDSIVRLEPPDAEAMVRIARRYSTNANGESLIQGSNADLQRAFTPLVGANAAFVREAVEVSKLAAIGTCSEDNKLILTPEAISAAVTSLMPHVKLLNPLHGIEPISSNSGEGNGTTVLADAGSMIMHEVAGALLDQLIDPRTISKVLKKGSKRMAAEKMKAGNGSIG
jgi:transitional endoplasmic reticulum ATPase